MASASGAKRARGDLAIGDRPGADVLASEEGVRLAQKMRTGPCIPALTQLPKAEVGPASGPTRRLSHLGGRGQRLARRLVLRGGAHAHYDLSRGVGASHCWPILTLGTPKFLGTEGIY